MGTLVGIGGGSGSGKTTLANSIRASATPGEVTIISVDSFYHSLPPGHTPEDINYDHPDSLDFVALQTCLAAIDRGEHAEIPVYDFATHTRVGLEWRPSTPLVLVEGILALAHDGIRSQLHLSIYVRAPEPIRFERRLVRDSRERGRSEESIREQWARTVRPMHHQFVAPTEPEADLVVDGTTPFEDSVSRILERVRLL